MGDAGDPPQDGGNGAPASGSGEALTALLPVHPSQLTLLPAWRAVHGIRST
jgi:hypothetical protein